MAINSKLNEPPKRGQKLCSQSVLYSEVPLYMYEYAARIDVVNFLEGCGANSICLAKSIFLFVVQLWVSP